MMQGSFLRGVAAQKVARRDATTRLGDGRRPPMAQILLLDRDRLFCEALTTLFAATDAMAVVATATTNDAALRLVTECPANVALVDARLPQRGAYRWVEQTHCLSEPIHVIFLDYQVTDARIAEALRLGVAGYFSRQTPFRTLAEGIATVVQGGQAFGKDIEKHLVATHRGLAVRATNDEPSLFKLTPREIQVFEMLAQGLSVRQCASRLQLAHSTVDNHKSRLMKKLNMHKSCELTRLAIREGMITP